MNIIITMAGQSRRFIEAGVKLPKWALQIDGRSVLEHAMESIAPLLDGGSTCIFVALDDPNHVEWLERCRRDLPWESTVLLLPHTPPGQALSALHGAELLPPDEPIAIWNVDTHLDPDAMQATPSDGNWLTLSPQPGTQWSFADLGSDGTVLRTAEKDRISRWASMGLYGFSSAQRFRDLVEEGQRAGITVREELYIAPLYNLLIENGEPVLSHLIDSGALTALGTPAEVIDSCRRRGWQVPPELVSAGEEEPPDRS